MAFGEQGNTINVNRGTGEQRINILGNKGTIKRFRDHGNKTLRKEGQLDLNVHVCWPLRESKHEKSHLKRFKMALNAHKQIKDNAKYGLLKQYSKISHLEHIIS